MARRGMGGLGQVGIGKARQGEVSRGTEIAWAGNRKAGPGRDRLAADRRGKVRAGLGTVRHGVQRSGLAGFGKGSRGTETTSRLGQDGLCKAGNGWAWQVKDGRGLAWQCEAGKGMASFGTGWRGGEWRGSARVREGQKHHSMLRLGGAGWGLARLVWDR